MKRLLMALLLIMIGELAFAGPSGKRGQPSPGPEPHKSQYEQEREQIDAIDRENLELDARYWAWRVAGSQDVTYEKLVEVSKNWVMQEDTKKLLLQKINDNIKNGNTVKPNAAELAKLQDGRDKIAAILSPGSVDEKMKAGLTMQYCVELEGRYWAWRVQNGEKEILTLMENWGKNSYTSDVRNRIRSNLNKKNDHLTREEAYKMQGCIKFKRK